MLFELTTFAAKDELMSAMKNLLQCGVRFKVKNEWKYNKNWIWLFFDMKKYLVKKLAKTLARLYLKEFSDFKRLANKGAKWTPNFRKQTKNFLPDFAPVQRENRSGRARDQFAWIFQSSASSSASQDFKQWIIPSGAWWRQGQHYQLCIGISTIFSAP